MKNTPHHNTKGRIRTSGIQDSRSDFFNKRAEKPKRGKRKPFSLAQLKRVLKACNDEWRGIVLFGFYTGQRLQDISRLTWENVDLEHEEIRLVTGKTKRPMTIPIPRPFLAYLLTLDAPDNPKTFLFPKAAPAPSTTLSRQFTDMLGNIGLREKRDHKGKGVAFPTRNAHVSPLAGLTHCGNSESFRPVSWLSGEKTFSGSWGPTGFSAPSNQCGASGVLQWMERSLGSSFRNLYNCPSRAS